MIIRCWHGWTLPENADAYENLLRTEIFPEIRKKSGTHLAGIELLRRQGQHEVEFVTLLRLDALDSVRAFAGADHEKAFVPPRARALLARFEERAAHFEQRYTQSSSINEGFFARFARRRDQ